MDTTATIIRMDMATMGMATHTTTVTPTKATDTSTAPDAGTTTAAMGTTTTTPDSATPPARVAAGAEPACGPTALTALPAASLLQLIWLASPALPVGGFSYSEGLEVAIESAGVRTEAAAAAWLLEQLQLTQARGDMAVVHAAVQAWRAGDHARVRSLNDWVLHTRETSELRLQTEQMGRSLGDWLRNQHAGAPDTLREVAVLAALPPTYPVAFALAAATTQARPEDVLLAYTFGWAENMVQAAIKSVPLGQNAGQRILAQLAAAIPQAVTQALQVGDDDRQAFSPMLAILSARHETQYSRLFRS